MAHTDMSTLFYYCHLSRQVGGGVVIYEVQRSARSEARKEEARKQELEVLALKKASFFNSSYPCSLMCIMSSLIFAWQLKLSAFV